MTKLEKTALLIIHLAVFSLVLILLNIIANILGTNIYIMVSLVILSSITAVWILK